LIFVDPCQKPLYVSGMGFWQGPIKELKMQKEPAVYILANRKMARSTLASLVTWPRECLNTRITTAKGSRVSMGLTCWFIMNVARPWKLQYCVKNRLNAGKGTGSYGLLTIIIQIGMICIISCFNPGFLRASGRNP
jgi:hypothetical protein